MTSHALSSSQGGHCDARGLAARVLAMLERQVAALEAEAGDGLFSDARVKALQLLAKTIQTMEGIVQKKEGADDEERARPGDILAFRRELAGKIAALGDNGPDQPLD